MSIQIKNLTINYFTIEEKVHTDSVKGGCFSEKEIKPLKRVLIISKTISNSTSKLDDLIKDIPKDQIKSDFRNPSRSIVELNNTDVYEAIAFSDSLRGRRATTLFLSKALTTEEIDTCYKSIKDANGRRPIIEFF